VKLTVGLTQPSSAWEQILAREGVSRAYVDFLKDRLDQEYSVIVATAAPEADSRKALQEYLSHGGALVGYAGDLGELCGLETRPEHIEYLLADGDGPDISLLDLDMNGRVARESNMLRTSSGAHALYLGACGGGSVALLPFDVNRCLYDTRPATRQFYARGDRLPFERVSRVGKGEMFLLVHRVLQRLHALRRMPYVRLADFPRGERSACVVRVDTDGASRAEVDELHSLAASHRLPLSWFLDVKSHEEWLQHFTNMVGDEVGVHCYRHQTYDRYAENLVNIRKAKELMVAAGLPPAGFAAPFGIWNPALAAAVDDSGFDYSSEFSYVYDAFPLFPATQDRQFSTLQLPVHPVCLGSLRRVGFTEPQMLKYMTSIIDLKLRRREPLFFYHHPRDRHVRVLDSLFSALAERSGRMTTMGKFARWWKTRLQVRFVAEMKPDTDIAVRAMTDDSDEVFLEVTRPDGYRSRLPCTETINLREVPWEEPAAYPAAPDDIRRIREFDLRTTVARVYASLLRGAR
jgi:peptidoglycan/xylan/chitin deacetylase (PgdA/CDA1 family)